MLREVVITKNSADRPRTKPEQCRDNSGPLECLVMQKCHKLSDKITTFEHCLDKAKQDYLTNTGWVSSCQFPDCCWRWTKEISGKVIAVGTTSAIRIQKELDPLPYDGENGHPEDYDGPCVCDTCMSYA